jgi:hypothetical protein
MLVLCARCLKAGKSPADALIGEKPGGVLHRAFRAGLGLQLSDRLPFPRHPRDPRAVSDPRLILDEFPDLVGDRPIGLGPE